MRCEPEGGEGNLVLAAFHSDCGCPEEKEEEEEETANRTFARRFAVVKACFSGRQGYSWVLPVITRENTCFAVGSTGGKTKAYGREHEHQHEPSGGQTQKKRFVGFLDVI